MFLPAEGFVLVDKPSGITSFGVVARVRRRLREQTGKKIKVGHTGTLDPFATGLMILVVGKECKNASKYSKLDKVYEATIILGKTSTTGDPEGEITAVSDKKAGLDEVKKSLKSLTGEIEQVPPKFSAIKVDGQRAYKLARAGKEVEIPKRKVQIYNLKLIEFEYPQLKIEVHVSSGTYIRTLAEDIGKSLGVGAYCSELRRIKVGKWRVEDATLIAP